MGVSWVHVAPSYSQVSESLVGSKLLRPPNNMVRCRVTSYAIAASLRALGAVAGTICVHVVPFHSHVSLCRFGRL